MSKGSNPRPYSVPKEQFRDNYDAIFGKKSKPADKETQPAKDTK